MARSFRNYLRDGWNNLQQRISQSGIGGILSTSFRVITKHVKNVALLDPKGFGEEERVMVPVFLSQVMDRQQPCELLPKKCFKRSVTLSDDRKTLAVNGYSFPVIPLMDNDGRMILDCNGRALYAISTNQEGEAFKLLGLSAAKYENKRLIVACEGGKVVPTSSKEVKVMRVVCNSEISGEARRIIDAETGKTVKSLTLCIAIPFNLAASVINIALMIPHGIFHYSSKLCGKVASYGEQKAHNIDVIKNRGTMVGGTQFSMPYKCLGAVFRVLDRVLAFFGTIVGGARSMSVGTLRSVPIFTNAAYNMSSGQFQTGKCLLSHSFSSAATEMKGYVIDTANAAKPAPKDLTIGGPTSASSPSSSLGSGTRGGGLSDNKKGRSREEELPSRTGNDEKNRKNVGRKAAEGAGKDLLGDGVFVSYGTSTQLHDMLNSLKKTASEQGSLRGNAR